jgi:hypothetical protein
MIARWIPRAVLLLLAVSGVTMAHATTPYPLPADADNVRWSLDSGGQDTVQSAMRRGVLGSSPGAMPQGVPPLSTQAPASPSLTSVASAGDGVWAEIPPPGPSGRDASTGIYDPIRRRFLAFGGYDVAHYRNDVWQLAPGEPAKWTRLVVAGEAPSGRSRASAIYDAAHDRMIVFGGWDGIQQFGDVWALSLTESPAWSRIVPSAEGPSPRSGHTANYDVTNDRMLVFGGTDGARAQNDVWSLSLDGAPIWTRVLPLGSAPSVRAYHAAVYDPVGQQLIVCGGFAGADGLMFLGDVWKLTSGSVPTWEKVITSGATPGPRDGMTAIYDPEADRLVMFGGNLDSQKNDVWVLPLRGAPVWQELTPTGDPPAPRFCHVAVYDSAGRRMIAFAGWGQGWMADAWSLSLGDAPAWTQMLPTALTPGRVYAASAFYDERRGRMLLLTSDLHLWALRLLGEPQWTEIVPDGPGPPSRVGAAVVLDPLRDRLVLQGGARYEDPLARYEDTWELSLGAPPVWRELKPQGQPPPGRDLAIAAYDPVGDRMILFGGTWDWARFYDDLWVLSLGGDMEWKPIVRSEPWPTPRILAPFALDPMGGRLVLFGGHNFGDSYAELWSLSVDGTPAWSLLPVNSPLPGERAGHSLVYDPLADRMVMLGGLGTPADLWALSLGSVPAWSLLHPVGSGPSLGGYHSAIYDRSCRRILVYGGTGNANDLWELRFDEPTPVTISLVSAQADIDHVTLTWYVAGESGLAISIERRTPESDWTAIGVPIVRGNGMIVFSDERITPGTRYGYRLVIQRGALNETTAETWVDVPARLVFALEGVRPNPSRGEALTVRFSLPTAAPARLELLDVAGRRIASHDVGMGQHTLGLGAGQHLAPGLYLVRLTQGANTRTTRVAVIR